MHGMPWGQRRWSGLSWQRKCWHPQTTTRRQRRWPRDRPQCVRPGLAGIRAPPILHYSNPDALCACELGDKNYMRGSGMTLAKTKGKRSGAQCVDRALGEAI